MTKAGIPNQENLSAQHLRAVVRWINACVVVGMILAAGLGAVALTGANAVRSEPAAAATSEPAEYRAGEKRLERSGILFGYEIVY